jgi:hypothetical protein
MLQDYALDLHGLHQFFPLTSVRKPSETTVNVDVQNMLDPCGMLIPLNLKQTLYQPFSCLYSFFESGKHLANTSGFQSI